MQGAARSAILRPVHWTHPTVVTSVQDVPDLQAVRSVLPAWVELGAWLAVPAFGCLVGVSLYWLCARCHPVRTAGLHWTEVARQHFLTRQLLAMQVAIHAALVTCMTWLFASGEWIGGFAAARALLAGLAVCLLTRPIAFRHARRHQPWLTWREFVDGQVVGAALYLAPLWLAVGLALGGPADFASDPLWAWAWYGLGSLALVWYLVAGCVFVLRVAGLLTDGDERLRRLLAAAEQSCGHTVRRVLLLRAPIANAAAMPHRNEIVVTTRALHQLTDDELTAILLHEVGHLREAPHSVWMRAAFVAPFLVVAWSRPIVAMVGYVGLTVAILGSLVLMVRAVRRLAPREVEADRHAQAHEPGQGSYARALERLHEIGLVPAVMPGKVHTHPHLYDRMLAAGVTPSFPRPLPPTRSLRQIAPFGLLAWLAWCGFAWALAAAPRRMYEVPVAAELSAVLDGGSLRSLGAIGYHWLGERPQDAAVVLRYVASRSAEPQYPAWLVYALVDADPAAARAFLQQAEARLAQDPEAMDWQRETVANARELLDSRK